jgi:hypothetical protein
MRNVFKVAVIALVLFAFSSVGTAQWLPAPLDPNQGVPSDWTTNHIVFSRGTAQNSGVIQEQPRYWIQQMLRRFQNGPQNNAQLASYMTSSARRRKKKKGHKGNSTPAGPMVQRDWSSAMGNAPAYNLESPTFPAHFTKDPSNPSCTNDFVAFTLPTGGNFPNGNFNIIGFNNLYGAGSSPLCTTGPVPTALFAYNASTEGGTLNGSPVVSLDGTQLAFIETANDHTGEAIFHVLKWNAGDVNTSTFPQAFNSSKLPNCALNGATAPCEYSVSYDEHPASLSSPWVDYASDTAYVTDDNGKLWAISPVFSGGQPHIKWSVTVDNSGFDTPVLTSPVFDSISGNVFVGDNGNGTEYFVRTPSSTVGSCARRGDTPPCLGSNSYSLPNGVFGKGTIEAAPIFDSTTGRVFLFGSVEGSWFGTDGSYLVQSDTQLSPASIRQASLGAGDDAVIQSGTFDNNYFNTGPAGGLLYACGAGAFDQPQLFAFSFDSSGLMSTSAVANPITLTSNSASASCSQITENYVGGIDRIFFGVSRKCRGGSNTNGCVMSYDVTAGFPSGNPSAQIAANGGSSGVAIDNISDVGPNTITTDVYYLTQSGQSCPDYISGNTHGGTCAVSATQSNLQ